MPVKSPGLVLKMKSVLNQAGANVQTITLIQFVLQDELKAKYVSMGKWNRLSRN